ncbi:MAG: thermonuclease family protein [Myxococcota bacterium]
MKIVPQLISSFRPVWAPDATPPGLKETKSKGKSSPAKKSAKAKSQTGTGLEHNAAPTESDKKRAAKLLATAKQATANKASEVLPKRGRIVSNYDGDTPRDNYGNSIRMKYFNAPEMRPREAFAVEAKEELATLLGVSEGTKEFDYHYGKRSRDGYGRLLTHLTCGKLIPAVEMVRKGLAHVFILDEIDDALYAQLLAAQQEAKDAKRGIWATKRYKNQDFSVSSFHANAMGRDTDNVNGEYFRLVNTSDKTYNLKGYTVTNGAGKSWVLDEYELKPGYSVLVATGSADMLAEDSASGILFLNSKKPIWDNAGDHLTVTSPRGKTIVDLPYKGKKIDPTSLPDPISQAGIRRLGSDLDLKYRVKKIRVEIKDIVRDDGDTIFIPAPKPGTFKVKINGEKRDIYIADQKESPKKMLAVRFMGADTPETHVMGRDGKPHSQGKPGVLAKKALDSLLDRAKYVEVAPNPERPFDVYDRLLGIVWVVMPDGSKINANEWLVEQGHAQMMAYYNGKTFDEKSFNRLSKKARKAVEEPRGIYDPKSPQYLKQSPADFRREVQGKPPADLYIADMASKKIYRSADAANVADFNRLWIPPYLVHEALKQLKLSKAY